ncbi:MAG: hypothetical protein H0Z25_05055 [Kosmotoga sp.]|uniref:hypothetical protein n=1 Tax=Kosmotoga sp. TaxID=1955248 RepID=UPI001D7886E6|nr:hypothetical protein [Kosmotoga sp.]MBO8166568.1 hypothetical protein [Kosmotoga sp.]
MLPKVSGEMTLKEIADLHHELYMILQHLGFDLNTGKMTSLKSSCRKKGLNLPEVLKALNTKVEELNLRNKKINNALKKQNRNI